MRPPVPLTAPGLPQGVGVHGELRDESGDRVRTHRFRERAVLARRSGTAPILVLRVDADDGVIHLDVHGSLQDDGLLTATVALCLRHGPGPDDDDIEAETTVVPAGGATAFELTFLDEDGCRVRALGSVVNGTGSPHPGTDEPSRRPS